MKKTSRVLALVVRAGKPAFEEISTDLKSMQEVVKGYVERVDLGLMTNTLKGFPKGLLAYVNEEGWLQQLPSTRTPFRNAYERTVFSVAGDYFIVRRECAALRAEDVHLLSRAYNIEVKHISLPPVWVGPR